MTLTTVLLDFGGTLIDQPRFLEAAHGAAVDAILELCLKAGVQDTQMIGSEYDVIRRVVMRMLRKEVDPRRYEKLARTLVYGEILALHGVEPGEEDVETVFRRMVECASSCRCEFPRTREALEALTGRYNLGIVSNGLAAYTRGSLAAQDLLRYFAVVVISEEENVEKPDCALFGRALSLLDAKPNEAVMVGNMLYEDICGARACGLRSVWLDSGEPQRSVACRPDATIMDIGDLPAALARLEREGG